MDLDLYFSIDLRVKYLIFVKGCMYGDKRIVRLMKLRNALYWKIVLC